MARRTRLLRIFPGFLLRGVRRMAVDAGDRVLLVVGRLEVFLVLLVMLGGRIDARGFRRVVLDEQPLQVAGIVGVDLVLGLDARDDDVLRVPLPPVVGRFEGISDLRGREVFAWIPLGRLV